MTEETSRAAKLEAETRKLHAEAEAAELDAALKRVELIEADLKRQQTEREEAEYLASDTMNGAYYFNDGVSTASVAKLRRTLTQWSRLHPGRDVRIVINSGGGSVFDGLDLMDCLNDIKATGSYVTTVIAGMAASMAGVLAQMGDTRIIGRHSRLHLHEVSTGSIGKASDIKDTADLAESLTRQTCAVYADRAVFSAATETMTADEIFDWIERQERWLSADEAVSRGFADQVG
ncbi:MAG: Clp protease ClpP [Acidimicrobiales bacterium]